MAGACKCREGFAGERCDKCDAGYFGFPNCQPCGCDEKGSQNNICDEKGRCPCKPKFGGAKCSSCAAGFYKFPECEPCGCDPVGSRGQACDDGICRCRDNFDGVKCNRCKKNFYNFPFCESCTCNPAGVLEKFGCQEGLQNKLCDCKAKVTGRYCERCVSQYKFLRASNPEGCEPCNCNRNGTINNMDGKFHFNCFSRNQLGSSSFFVLLHSGRFFSATQADTIRADSIFRTLPDSRSAFLLVY